MSKIIVCSPEEMLRPIKKEDWDVCWDMKIADDLTIEPGKMVTIGTGVKTVLPAGWQCRVYARSSLPVKNGLMLANSVAIFDVGYRGEYIMQFYNFTDKTLFYEKGTRLTQMEFAPFYVWSWIYWNWETPELEFIVDKNTYDNFAEIYPSIRWGGGLWSSGNK